MTQQERRRGQLKRDMERDIARYWRYCGGKFVVNGTSNVEGFAIGWSMTHKFHSLKSIIDTERKYGIPNVEQDFAGDDAFDEALDWLIEKLFETVDVLHARVRPYLAGKVMYDMALGGGNSNGILR